MVACPLCDKPVIQNLINEHIDSGCADHVIDANADTPATQKTHSFFTPAGRSRVSSAKNGNPTSSPIGPPPPVLRPKTPPPGTKRSFDDAAAAEPQPNGEPASPAAARRKKLKAVEDAQRAELIGAHQIVAR